MTCFGSCLEGPSAASFVSEASKLPKGGVEEGASAKLVLRSAFAQSGQE